MESMSLPSQDNKTYLSRIHDLAFSWGDQVKKLNSRKQRKDVGKEPKVETSMA